MSPLIPLFLLLLGIVSVSAAFGLTMTEISRRNALLVRQDAFIATQVEMIRDRDTQLARKAAEVTTMAKFVRIIVEKRLREEQEGGESVKGSDGAAEAGAPSTVPIEAFTGGVPSIAGGEAQ